MDAGFEAHLQVGAVTFDRTDAALLRAVDDHGSLNRAADALGRSYSRALERVTTLESALGPLVDRQRGGAQGGGSELTDNARTLLARFARLQAALAGTADTEDAVLEGPVVDRGGELVTVETAAGRVRALLLEEAERVQVTVPADAVTLHAPDGAPEPAASSARNRFRGTVRAIDESEAIAHVTVALGPDVQLRVVITRRSLEMLDISPDADVLLTFKATATRAVPA